MQISLQNKFKDFVKEILNLPVWIKQIIYMELKEQLESSQIACCMAVTRKEDCLQLYIPKLTYTGKKELETKTKKLSPEVYSFLESAYQGISIIETAIKNNWNLSECSSYFLEAIDNNLLISPSSEVIKGTALYMSGRIRLGEYFVKINKISIEQLGKALKAQKDMEEERGDRPGLADILISMNFVSKADTEVILLLKEDCKKRYSSVS